MLFRGCIFYFICYNQQNFLRERKQMHYLLFHIKQKKKRYCDINFAYRFLPPVYQFQILSSCWPKQGLFVFCFKGV